MAKFVFIVNPAGRDGRSLKRWKSVETILNETEIEREVYFTEYVGHASEIAYSLRERVDIDCVVACGGDGTVHEIASGLRNSDKKLGKVLSSPERIQIPENINEQLIVELYSK